MHEFRVWSPDRRRVEVVTGRRRVPMLLDGRAGAGAGWWTGSVEDAGPGTDYAFRLDDGPPRPDPRSAWQPQGIHGPSRVVDHAAFGWTDAGWRGLPLAGSVLYECHIGTFSAEGTFDGAIAHLGHLRSLRAVTCAPVSGVGLWQLA